MVTVTFNVDMTTPIGDASFVVGTDMVYVTGDFNGWDEPGKGESMMLTDADADNIYSGVMAMDINKGEIQYKYFKNAGWVGGEWEGEPNRKITIADVDYVIDPADIWGDKPVSVSDNKLSLVSLYPNPVKNQLTIANLEGVSKVTVSNVLGQSILTKNVTKSEMTINTSELRNGIYIVTLVSENGSTRSQRIVKQ